MSTSAQPRTRDLLKVIDACKTVEDELRFQVQRLTVKLKADKDHKGKEDEYLNRLCELYDKSIGTITTLRRYHEGRMGILPPRETEFDGAITHDGVAHAAPDK